MIFRGRFFNWIALMEVKPGALEFLTLLNEYFISPNSMGLISGCPSSKTERSMILAGRSVGLILLYQLSIKLLLLTSKLGCWFVVNIFDQILDMVFACCSGSKIYSICSSPKSESSESSLLKLVLGVTGVFVSPQLST